MGSEEEAPLWRLQTLPAERGPQVRGRGRRRRRRRGAGAAGGLAGGRAGQTRPPETRSRAGLRPREGREEGGGGAGLRGAGPPFLRAGRGGGDLGRHPLAAAGSCPSGGFARRLCRAGRTLALVGGARCSQ